MTATSIPDGAGRRTAGPMTDGPIPGGPIPGGPTPSGPTPSGSAAASLTAGGPTADGAPVGRLRTMVCVGTIAAALPYLTLKIAWIAGAHVGVHGDAMDSSTMVGANVLTLAMDSLAALIALALVRPRGRRLPAAALVFPMWVATGFLGPVLVVAPLSAVVGSLAGGGRPSGTSSGGLDGWVYGVVYGGFAAQGVGLLLGFVLYARSRWRPVFRARLADLPAGRAFAAQRAVIGGVGLFSLIPSGIHLYWAAGGTALRPGDDRTWAVRLVSEAAFALLPLAGTAGMLALAWRRDPRPARGTLTAAWLGTGAMFSWGLWWLLAASVSTPLSQGSDLRGLGLTGGLGMLAGATLAVVLGLTVAGVAVGGEPAGPAPRAGAPGVGPDAGSDAGSAADV